VEPVEPSDVPLDDEVELSEPLESELAAAEVVDDFLPE
jgi:hypothetical protein